MNERGWEELVDLIDQKFGINTHKKFSENLADAPELHHDIDRIEFEKSGEVYRIERITGPAIIDKKTFYHKTGSSQHTQYVYDSDDITSKVDFYHQERGEWVTIKPESLFS